MANQEKIYIGRIDNESIYLSKHSWNCGWYWGFGYVGNNNLHFHISSLINEKDDKGKYPEYEVNQVFQNSIAFNSPVFTQKQWWVIRDLFIQAYALKKSAEVFRYGGHQTTLTGVTDILKDTTINEIITEELFKEVLIEDFINQKLRLVLDTVWQYMIDSIEENKAIKEKLALEKAELEKKALEKTTK